MSVRRAGKRVLLALAVVLGVAVPARAQGPVSCNVLGQNLYVRDVMTALYYWYREMPAANPLFYDSPQAYLDAVRYRPLDQSFSYITDRASSDAFFSNSQFIGLGLSTRTEGSELRLTDVYPDSPASEANLLRGDRVLEINGRRVSDLIATGAITDAFGPAEIGFPVTLVVQRGAEQFAARSVKRLVTIPTVSRTRTWQVGSRRVGYLSFRNFVEPSYAALDAAFVTLREQGVNELVLDLRYNGGGLVGVAQFLASLIGGARTDGHVFAEYFHNDKQAAYNRTVRFEPQANALGLDRLIVITTRASASASELIINALRPFIPVDVIGSRTYGKPVGQYGIEFCDKVLAPVAFTLRNANGEGDFFEGFAPTCAAADDLDHALGDPSEASLREAMTLIGSGRCSSSAAAASAARAAASPHRPAGTAWQLLVGAY